MAFLYAFLRLLFLVNLMTLKWLFSLVRSESQIKKNCAYAAAFLLIRTLFPAKRPVFPKNATERHNNPKPVPFMTLKLFQFPLELLSPVNIDYELSESSYNIKFWSSSCYYVIWFLIFWLQKSPK